MARVELAAAKEAETIEEAREQIAAAENVAEVANRIACTVANDNAKTCSVTGLITASSGSAADLSVCVTGLEPAL